MQQHFFSIKRKVEIDECPGCGGIWLDAGELSELRDLYKTESERKQAASEVFDSQFGDKLKSMSKQSLEKGRRVANAFKYICPSYYIPGDQKWGAF